MSAQWAPGAAALPELGVIGWPLTRTFSPAMHAAALARANLKWRYEAIPVAPADLPAFLSRASFEMRGFNVTIPHKAAVFDACAIRDDLARASGAVNTIVCRGRGQTILEGHNTDGSGLLKALSERADLDPRGGHALLLGAGGAAAGCAAALAGAGAARITVMNRTTSRATTLIDRLRASFPDTEWSHCPLGGPSLQIGHVCLVINCIPEEPASDLARFIEAISRDKSVFCDMSYSAGPTRLASAAAAAGHKVVPGLEVLLWQGVYAFEILTGEQASESDMRDALTSVAGGWWLEC